jgi:hypothetical protein
MAGSSEDCNEPSNSLRAGNFLQGQATVKNLSHQQIYSYLVTRTQDEIIIQHYC